MGVFNFKNILKPVFVTQKNKAYSETYQTPKMELFVKIVDGWRPIAIFAKSSIWDAWQGSEYASRVTWFVCFRFCLGFFKQNCNSITMKCFS